MSEINDIFELPEGIFSYKQLTNINGNTLDYWLNIKRYVQNRFFCEIIHMYFNIIMCEDKICIMSTLQS